MFAAIWVYEEEKKKTLELNRRGECDFFENIKDLSAMRIVPPYR